MDTEDIVAGVIVLVAIILGVGGSYMGFFDGCAAQSHCPPGQSLEYAGQVSPYTPIYLCE